VRDIANSDNDELCDALFNVDSYKLGLPPCDDYGLSMMVVMVSNEENTFGSLGCVYSRYNLSNAYDGDVLDEDELSEVIGAPYQSVFKPYKNEEVEEESIKRRNLRRAMEAAKRRRLREKNISESSKVARKSIRKPVREGAVVKRPTSKVTRKPVRESVLTVKERPTRKPIRRMESVKRPLRPVRPTMRNRVIESRKLTEFDDSKFNAMMNRSVIRENFEPEHGAMPVFNVRRVLVRDNKVKLEYIVREGRKVSRGIMLGEGFNKNASRMVLKFRNKGVFTESMTKTPAFIVECRNVNGKLTPIKIDYDFKTRINESVYRVTNQKKR
jgi:hypothetical protein